MLKHYKEFLPNHPVIQSMLWISRLWSIRQPSFFPQGWRPLGTVSRKACNVIFFPITEKIDVLGDRYDKESSTKQSIWNTRSAFKNTKRICCEKADYSGNRASLWHEPFLTITAYKRRLQLLLVGDYLIRNTLGNKTITSSEMFEYQTDIQSNKLTIP